MTQPAICQAPGKAVLSGEYAVLIGAPSLVMAVNRYAQCTITPNNADLWHFESLGFSGTSKHSVDSLFKPQLMSSNDPARLLGWALKASEQTTSESELVAVLPKGAHVVTNTQAMYQGNSKLGLGSSAALITAIAGSLTQLITKPTPQFDALHQAHNASQGGVGSGLDIATALSGGILRFRDGQSQKTQWPDELHYRFVYSGKPASTGPLVKRFNAWRAAAPNRREPDALLALFDASSTLANTPINLDNLSRYVGALRTMDDASNIGIFSPEHKSIALAAERHRLIYKPCGAGGGDLGVAISDSQRDLDEFTSVISKNFAVIDLEIAEHGLTNG